MQLTVKHYDRLRETVTSAILPCGLRIMSVPRTGWLHSYAVLMTGYGSIDNQFRLKGEEKQCQVPDGIAHFLEHQLFAQPWGSADERFAALGASSNAFTSWNRTGYLVSTTSNFIECLRFLTDFVYEPYFTEQGTVREQGIIEQEIGMYLDDPHWNVYLQLLQGLFHHHPVRLDIAGSSASVRQITKELLELCYQTFYHPSNMVLVLIGDFHETNPIQAVADHLANKQFGEIPEVERVYPLEPASICRAETTTYASINSPLFALGFKDREVGLAGATLFRRQVLTELLLHAVFGKSAPLFQQLYAAGLFDGELMASYVGYADHGYTVLQCESQDPATLRARILAGLTELLASGVSEERFALSQKALHGDFLQGLNDLEGVANELADSHFQGIDALSFPEVLQSITLDDVNQRLRDHLQPDWSAFSQVLPLPPEEEKLG